MTIDKGDRVRIILDAPVLAVFSDGYQIGDGYNSAVILNQWIRHVERIAEPDERHVGDDHIVRGYN